MRFAALTLLVASATTCLADGMRVVTVCTEFGYCNSRRGTFQTDYGFYPVDANDGCRGTSVPGMVEFCVDWARQRGHFRFDHQSFKRCMRKASESNMSDPLICPTNNSCVESWWEETPCNWREVPVEPEATVSATAAAVPVETETSTRVG
jgi:hypothetical protein